MTRKRARRLFRGADLRALARRPRLPFRPSRLTVTVTIIAAADADRASEPLRRVRMMTEGFAVP